MTDTFADFLNSIPVRGPRKPRKPKPTQGRYDLKKLYYDARRVMFEREYKQAWDCGEYYDNKMPDVTTTNGFTRYIEDVINNLGHHAERVNSMGVPMYANGKPVLDRNGKPKFRRSGSTNGSTDIHCEIKVPSQALPAGWKIEVKNKDSVLKAQQKYQDKMQRVGVLHTVIYNLDADLFWDELNRILAL